VEATRPLKPLVQKVVNRNVSEREAGLETTSGCGELLLEYRGRPANALPFQTDFLSAKIIFAALSVVKIFAKTISIDPRQQSLTDRRKVCKN
jgi:hypothetical protein